MTVQRDGYAVADPGVACFIHQSPLTTAEILGLCDRRPEKRQATSQGFSDDRVIVEIAFGKIVPDPALGIAFEMI